MISEVQEDSSHWGLIASNTQLTAIWLFLIGRSIFTLASLTTAVIISYRRKRTGFMYLGTPITFCLSGIFGTWVQLVFLNKHFQGEQNPVSSVGLLLAVHYMFYALGHQFFASQYLQTSLTMPIVFTEARLEYAMQSAQPKRDAIGKNEWKSDKIRTELQQ